MRILTWNLWLIPIPFFGSRDIESRFNPIVETILAAEADLILLQEVFSPNLRRQLILNLATHGYHFHSTPSPLWHGGLLMVSKIPFEGRSDFVPHREWSGGLEPFLMKGTHVAKLKTVSPRQTYVANFHLGDRIGPNLRKRQIERVFAKFDYEFANARLIFGGDLNFRNLGDDLNQDSAGREPGYDFLVNQHQFIDIQRTALKNQARNKRPFSYSSANSYNQSGDLALDFVFCRGWRAFGNTSLVGTERFESAEGKQISNSDHYGLIVEIDEED